MMKCALLVADAISAADADIGAKISSKHQINDGVSIAEIDLEDPYERIGAELSRKLQKKKPMMLLAMGRPLQLC